MGGQARGSSPLVSSKGGTTQFTKEDQLVLACIRIAKKHRINNPYKLAKENGWTQDQWDTALASYQAKQWKQMQESRSEENDDE